jgi:hypothetical protein
LYLPIPGYDVDGDTLVASLFDGPFQGTFYQVDSTGQPTNTVLNIGDPVTNIDFLVNYRPATFFFGIDTFQYIVTDTSGSASFSLSVAIQVDFVNQPPFANSGNSTSKNFLGIFF